MKTVPKMAGAAPKFSVTGFQSVLTTNARPKCWIAGIACCSSVRTIRRSNAGTALATMPTTHWNPSRGRLVTMPALASALTAMAQPGSSAESLRSSR